MPLIVRLPSVHSLRARLGSRAFLASLPFLSVIVLAAVLSVTYHALLRRQRDMVEHTYRVITALETTSSRIVDAETGQRGFVMRDRGRILMDEVRETIAQMRAAETDLLRQRAASAQATAHRLILVTALCTLLSWMAKLVLALLKSPRNDDGRTAADPAHARSALRQDAAS